MANAVKWSAQGTYTQIINGDASAPTLKNLADGAKKLGIEVDGATERNQYGDFVLDVRGASSFASTGVVQLYLIPCIDGTNYVNGSDSIVPGGNLLAYTFQLQAVSTQQKLGALHIQLPACKWKPLILNNGGQAFTNTDNENVLSYRPYNDEIQ